VCGHTLTDQGGERRRRKRFGCEPVDQLRLSAFALKRAPEKQSAALSHEAFVREHIIALLAYARTLDIDIQESELSGCLQNAMDAEKKAGAPTLDLYKAEVASYMRERALK
jgi:hypothetical protein